MLLVRWAVCIFFIVGNQLAFMLIPVSELRTAHFVRNLTIASYVGDMHYQKFMNFELCWPVFYWYTIGISFADGRL